MNSSKQPDPTISESRTKSAFNFPANFKDVRDEYRRADSFCSEVQSFCGKAGIPAINELRNAGKHLFDAIDENDVVSNVRELESSLAHSRRAAYEASEAGILMCLEIINKFKEDYRDIPISTVLPDWSDLLLEAQESQKAVEAGRSNSDLREGDHESRMASFRELRTICSKLDVSRNECNKLVTSQRRDTRRFMTNCVIGIIAIFITIALAIIFR